ncbi:peptidase domain-containing ABC transporter [Colwellia psychrerythraea]|uniref:ABC transporter, ATP-binding/permease protein n=1 Tax=Colwellia psychrerythraea (strain 34H / ATCC BAA-681) TaxID=167879 RepID=Q47W47_COLP3|nr:ATP-binding cassette domain-containing protein [Colwellia psychrerythraea]AAZ24853.1 ABC transporter, ATP-binding/permease protein [Colwellia psychrerythraea 34H]
MNSNHIAEQQTVENASPQTAAPDVVDELTLEQALLQQALPVNVLKNLLDKLETSVQTGALVNACQQAETQLPQAPVIKRLYFVFNALKLKGIQAAQVRWTRFDQRRLPAMLFTHSGWILVEHAKENKLLVTNEAGESEHCTHEQLETGIVLWLRVAKKSEQSSIFSLKGNIAARLVFSKMFKNRRWLIDIIVATVIINVLAVSTAIFAMQVYDRVVPTLAYATLTTLVMGMFIVVVLDWFLKTIRARTLDSVSCAVDKAVSQQVFDHVMHLQLDERPRSLGTLAAQVSGLDSVRQFFSSGVVFALVDLPFALFFIGMIALIGGHIGWVYLMLLPIALTLGWMTQRRLRRLLKQQMMRSNERQGLLVDAIKGAESIRANNATWRFSAQWQEITQTISSYNIRQKAISNFATVSTGSLSTAAYISAIVVGVGQIEAGNLTMGALIACSILGGRVIAPVAQSVQYFSQWQNVAQALEMVNQVLLLNTERRVDQNLLLPDELPKKISLDGIMFSYPESPIRQLNINKLTFTAGDRVVLLGAIGSGKSTLLKVLAGLYKPAEGRIKLGQADLWEIEPNIVADQVSYLPQSVHLFKGTLRSNLALSGAVSDSHLLQVSEQLGIDKIAADDSLGMELAISEGGEGLSGGQRQLVGLGRTFLAQPKIWLLDEPTATLDNESEQKVLQALLDNVKTDDILIISTHRPALAAKMANRVIVMQHGEIINDGKPEDVLSKIMSNVTKNKATVSSRDAPTLRTPKGFVAANVNQGDNHVI